MDFKVLNLVQSNSRLLKTFKALYGPCRTLLSDGEATTYNHIASLNVYGDSCHIEKEECVNHVEMRLGVALRKVAL